MISQLSVSLSPGSRHSSDGGATAQSCTQDGEDTINELLNFAEGLGVASTPSPKSSSPQRATELTVAGCLNAFKGVMVVSLPTLGPALRYTLVVNYPKVKLAAGGLVCVVSLDSKEAPSTQWIQDTVEDGTVIARECNLSIPCDRELVLRTEFMVSLLGSILESTDKLERCEDARFLNRFAGASFFRSAMAEKRRVETPCITHLGNTSLFTVCLTNATVHCFPGTPRSLRTLNPGSLWWRTAAPPLLKAWRC